MSLIPRLFCKLFNWIQKSTSSGRGQSQLALPGHSVQGSVTLLLNSDDLQLINEQRSQLFSEFPQINGLKVEVGEGIERGGCVLESAMGRIDASLHSKFKELNRLLL